MSSVIKVPSYETSQTPMYIVRVPGYEFEKNSAFSSDSVDYLVIQDCFVHKPIYAFYNNEKFLNKKTIPTLNCKLFSKTVNCAIFAVEHEVVFPTDTFKEIKCTTLNSNGSSDEATINLVVKSVITLGDENKFFKNFIFNTDFEYYKLSKLLNIYTEFATKDIIETVKKLDVPVKTYNLNKDGGVGLDEDETKLYKAIETAVKKRFALVGLNVDLVMCEK